MDAPKAPPPAIVGRGTAENPKNRFLRLEVELDPDEYDPEEPRPKTVFLKDTSRTIIAYNRSPDIGYNASINPYRGCEHGCVYCLAGDTPILMADGTTRSLEEVRPGDLVCGTFSEGRHRRYVRTQVLAHWRVVRPAYRVTLADGTCLVTGADHRFLTARGWKFVTGAERGGERRPYLTPKDTLMGVGALAPSPRKGYDDKQGYLCSTPRGDGLLASYARGYSHQFGGFREHLRFPRSADPGMLRDISGQAVTSGAALQVRAVEPLGVRLPLFDITTGTGDFIANGVVSHNCYARPTHEYLGFSAGLDFETKILVKTDAPKRLRKELASPRWQPQVIGFSGVTDIYQPVERKLMLTRRCLEVILDFRNPVGMITKNHLITRDIDLLSELAKHKAVTVAVSLTTLDDDLRRVLEPRTSSPERRLAAIAALATAGIPVGVMTAPIIPGLNDHEIPSLVKAAADAGAGFAGYSVVHLPHGTAALFKSWLTRHRPERKDKVLNRIRAMRGGKLNDPRFSYRMSGEGIFAEQIALLFRAACRKAGLPAGERFTLSTAAFRRPGVTQPGLFD